MMIKRLKLASGFSSKSWESDLVLENRTRRGWPMKEALFGVKQHLIVFMDIIPRNSGMVNTEPILWYQDYAWHKVPTHHSTIRI